jgi:signal transduction histidine kinase
MTAPLQVLLIEDNTADASMIADLLTQARGWAFALTWVSDLSAGIGRLRGGGIDLVLLDLGLPESTGLATVQRLMAQGVAVPTLIVLSGITDEEIAIKTLQLGAQDYLVKGQVDSALLLRAIRYAIGRRQAEEAMTRELLRTRELANEKAVRVKAENVSEELRRLLEERDQMLAEREDMLRLLAHEVRQPLNNASAALESASSAIANTTDAPEAGARAPLARAQHVLDHVIGTLNNALAAASLLTSGAIDVMADTDLHTLVGLVVRDIAVEDRPRVVIDSRTGTRTVQLHPILMRLALTNLLFNALAYSPPGSVVRLRISDSEEPLAMVFEVEDAGDGISAELLPRVFDKGTRGTHARATAGAGLGLYIVRKVVDMHHGTVEIVPNRPRGSIVRMSIPQGVEV